MRRTLAFAALVTSLGGCHHNLGVTPGTAPAHRLPRTTSVLGDWVLGSSADSTAFAGATLVEMNLGAERFSISATYPDKKVVTVSGTIDFGENNSVTLTPTEGGEGLAARGTMALRVGRQTTLIASAAGATLVFAPPASETPTPSSVWNRKGAARDAGRTP